MDGAIDLVCINDRSRRACALNGHRSGNVQIAGHLVSVAARIESQTIRSRGNDDGDTSARKVIRLHDRCPESADAIAGRRLANPVIERCAGLRIDHAIYRERRRSRRA